MGDKLRGGNGEVPSGVDSLEAKPPPQIGLILHDRLCRAPSLLLSPDCLIRSFTSFKKGNVIKILQQRGSDEKQSLRQPLKKHQLRKAFK